MPTLSNLSYLGEWNEYRENARASGETAKGFSRGSLRLPKLESLLAGYAQGPHEQMYSGIQVPLTKNPDSSKWNL